MAKMTSMISYLRVSTTQQGKSGLGLEAQRATIAQFAAAEGLEIAREFVEVETGKGSDALERRPQLRQALAVAKKLKCAVVVAKLVRSPGPRRQLHPRPYDEQGTVHRHVAGSERRSFHAAHLRGLG
jgi:Resolvase, N terminal domain